jgi:hypothetical protein
MRMTTKRRRSRRHPETPRDLIGLVDTPNELTGAPG